MRTSDFGMSHILRVRVRLRQPNQSKKKGKTPWRFIYPAIFLDFEQVPTLSTCRTVRLLRRCLSSLCWLYAALSWHVRHGWTPLMTTIGLTGLTPVTCLTTTQAHNRWRSRWSDMFSCLFCSCQFSISIVNLYVLRLPPPQKKKLCWERRQNLLPLSGKMQFCAILTKFNFNAEKNDCWTKRRRRRLFWQFSYQWFSFQSVRRDGRSAAGNQG